tara:strand:+ start:16298 stop:16501 length:204 start_codon:yes stop_codon:yes gene_type:complete
MNKNMKECLIHKLNETCKQISNIENSILISKKDNDMKEWFEIELTILENVKIMIQKALINDHLEEAI